MKIYLAGSMSASREFENGIRLISDNLEEMGHIIVTKSNVVQNNDKVKNKKLLSSRKYIVKRDQEWLKDSDLFIAEVSIYSHGVGYEHRYAEDCGKPILMLRHSSLKKDIYSAFLDGQNYDKMNFSFYDSGNIRKILERFIKKYER